MFVDHSNSRLHISFFFFFNDTATTEIYTLSLHDALPICAAACSVFSPPKCRRQISSTPMTPPMRLSNARTRSEEHTSELQSQSNLVCRLLLEKKKKKHTHGIQPSTASQTHRKRYNIHMSH